MKYKTINSTFGDDIIRCKTLTQDINENIINSNAFINSKF